MEAQFEQNWKQFEDAKLDPKQLTQVKGGGGINEDDLII